jgi:hypothetical protein
MVSKIPIVILLFDVKNLLKYLAILLILIIKLLLGPGLLKYIEGPLYPTNFLPPGGD